MRLMTHRGRVEDLTTPDKRGAAQCRIGKVTLKLHKDLVTTVNSGDEIYVAGKYGKGVMIVFAVNNLTRGRVTQLDGTNNMLLLGFLGWLGIQAAALLPMFSDEWPIWSVLMALTVFGLGGVFRSIRELVLINRAGKWVAYP
jgi:hypothetical protein